MKFEKTDQLPPEKRHEQSDVPIVPVIVVMAVLALLTVLTLIGLWALFNHFTGERAVPKSVQIDTEIEAENVAPPPRLQDSPAQDMATWQAAEEAELNRFGWVDRERKIVKVPIERAFEVLVEEKNQQRNESAKPGLTPLELRQQRALEQGGSQE